MVTVDDTVDPFFDPEFTTEAEYRTGEGLSKMLDVIFDAEYSVTVVGGVEQQNKAPQAVCRSVDVSGANSSCTVRIGRTTYNVIDVQDDGTGFTTLILSKD